MSNQPEPKLFISYSWSGPDHEARVLRLAEDLTAQGIEVILDKWHLQPGHDANAFMESMVTDPTVTKVALICDSAYAQKSNARSGGAGAEAQIISPELYAKKAQDKFVAVIFQRDDDGKPYIPAYYGSRIYIDLTSPSTGTEEFERLVRWVWDRPLHIRPEKGAKPTFLADETKPAKIATSLPFRRALDSIRNNSLDARTLVAEFFLTLATGLGEFRIKLTPENTGTMDDLIVASIGEFLPYRNQALEMFSAVAQYTPTADMLHAIHRFFEQMLVFTERPELVGSWHEAEFDNFRFMLHELFLYALAAFLRFERFDAFAYFVDNEYFWDDPNDRNVQMHSYPRFRSYLRSLEYRNQRLKMGRLSLAADMLHERNKGASIDFKFVMAADFILYFRSQNSDYRGTWWPDTLLYLGRRFTGAFEIFARAKSTRYFDRIKGLLRVNSKEELRERIEIIKRAPNDIPRWQHHGIDLDRLMSFETLATTP